MIYKVIVPIILIAGLVITGFWWWANRQPDISNFDLSRADNWYLSTNVKLSLRGGIYDYWSDKVRPNAENVELSWKQVSPEEGEYDWSILKNRLDIAKQNGRGIWLRIYTTDLIHVPDWVKNKYSDLKELNYGGYQENMNGWSQGKFYPLWHAGFELEIARLLQSLSQQQIIQDPDFYFMYAPFAWRWNEWELKFIPELENDGYTPTKFLEWFKTHLELYTSAFKGFETKLMYTGSAAMDYCDGNANWIKSINNLNTGQNKMTDIAVGLGMSVRIGDLEYFNNYNHIPSWGRKVEFKDGFYYQSQILDHPLITDTTRLIGSENEGFGDASMLGGTKNYYFARMNTFKSLQVGVNWINTQATSYELAPEVYEYARKVVGKSNSEQPDAWVDLREWKDLSQERFRFLGKENLPFDPDIPIRNWEKLLYQREVEDGGKTKAVIKVGGDKSFPFFYFNGESFEAISTDLDNQNNYIYFKLDDRFKDQNKNYKLAITYLGDSEDNFEIQYQDKSSLEQKIIILKQGYGNWNTTIVDLNNIEFNGRYSNGMDFRLYNGGKSNLVVSFVRLIKE